MKFKDIKRLCEATDYKQKGLNTLKEDLGFFDLSSFGETSNIRTFFDAFIEDFFDYVTENNLLGDGFYDNENLLFDKKDFNPEDLKYSEEALIKAFYTYLNDENVDRHYFDYYIQEVYSILHDDATDPKSLEDFMMNLETDEITWDIDEFIDMSSKSKDFEEFNEIVSKYGIDIVSEALEEFTENNNSYVGYVENESWNYLRAKDIVQYNDYAVIGYYGIDYDQFVEIPNRLYTDKFEKFANIIIDYVEKLLWGSHLTIEEVQFSGEHFDGIRTDVEALYLFGVDLDTLRERCEEIKSE